MENESIQIDFFKLLKIYKRKFLIILIITVIGALLSGYLGFHFIKPKYSSTATIYLEQNELELQKTILTSRSVLECIISENNLDYSYDEMLKMLKIENSNNNRICFVTIESNKLSLSKKIVDDILKKTNTQLEKDFNSAFKIIEYGNSSLKQSNLSYKKIGIIGGFLFLLIVLLYLFFDMILNEKIDNEKEIEKYLELNILSSVPNYKKKGKRND